MMVHAVRGAIQIGSNTREAVTASATELIKRIFKINHLTKNSIISIIFSVTKDITAYNPAAAIRLNGFDKVPLFCVQEAYMEAQMPLIIRVLITYNSKENINPVPVYLNGAEKLRPDLFR
ncbi:MAG: chorismate mutase [Spirochaetales bacterium]|nr:chorismate mutase [Spirochaetales bacterium]